MNTDNDLQANDLTQLSSREQLSALMDGALPPDETRFLLRRLQHDTSLAESWERWRTAGEVMRGLAPTRRMPADFAARVSAALHGDAVAAPAQAQQASRMPQWLRWGGGAAMAASLAMVALIVRTPQHETPASVAATVAAAPVTTPVIADVPAPQPQPVTVAAVDVAPQTLAANTVRQSAPAPRVARRAARDATHAPMAVAVADVAVADHAVAVLPVVVPQPEIATRPWPRSVLPQYSNDGLTVGFGEPVHRLPVYAPLQAPVTPVQSPAADPASEVHDDTSASPTPEQLSGSDQP
ncbi:MAG: sigma-E factor negative regulatory protein [Thermomonas sp.]|uniref:sigma-E factor negative regulatory protein n=1 Tax=Thermomonas sp. TaxID=1971895 RepID=UPI0039E361AE